MKKVFVFIWEVIKITAVALIIVIPIRYFLFQPFVVRGQSMEPSFNHGDYLIVNQISYRLREPQREEVIVFKYPGDPTTRHIKRIIGLPQETIEIKDSKITIYSPQPDGTIETIFLNDFVGDRELKVSLEEGEYFVMGDNREVSFDSRRWGALPRENIIGFAWVKVFSFSEIINVFIFDN